MEQNSEQITQYGKRPNGGGDITAESNHRENNPMTEQHQNETERSSPDNPLFTFASDEEVRKAYLESKKEWEEVYRRLADS